jgi:hypothetical protein
MPAPSLPNTPPLFVFPDDQAKETVVVHSEISGTTSMGTGVDVDFKDILGNLEFGAMAACQARKGKWSLLTDVIYLDVSGDHQLDLIPPIGGDIINVSTNVNLDLTGWVIHQPGRSLVHALGRQYRRR